MTRQLTWVHGITGRMGQKLFEQLDKNKDFQFFGGSAIRYTGGPFDKEEVKPETLSKSLEKPSVILDFSSSSANKMLLEACESGGLKKKSILIGTTQIAVPTLHGWKALAKKNDLSILVAPNTSIGILILSHLLKEAAPIFQKFGFDCEMVESHHKDKVDSPSGTALQLAECINADLPKKLKVEGARTGRRDSQTLGIHSIRGGGVFGEHTVEFLSEHEVVTLSHRALSRTLFADGAIKLARWLTNQKPGYYDLQDIEFESLTSS